MRERRRFTPSPVLELAKSRSAVQRARSLPISISSTRGASFAHDFSRVPAHDRSAPGGGAPSSAPAPAAPISSASTPVTVDAIDIVAGPTGAISGYPMVTTGNLNSPGPFNNPTSHGVSNIHQIQFHLDQGDSAAVTPRRELQRSAWVAGVESRNPADVVIPPVLPGIAGLVVPGGFSGAIVGPDGPAAHEVRRPATDRIVVADAPGIAALSASQFPYIYRSHFTVTLAAGGRDIARARYDVRIEKTSETDVPNRENSITSVTKEDLIRGRSLL